MVTDMSEPHAQTTVPGSFHIHTNKHKCLPSIGKATANMIGTIIIWKFETPPHSANPPQEASATVLTMFYKTEAQIEVRDHFLLFLIFLEIFMPWEQQSIEKK